MSAALSQPDAARFTIYIDAMIESPRLNFTAFCTAARISAAEALAWLNRADIKTALQSCMDAIQLSARIRHAVLDTNAMGTLGQILKTSENQVELRRVATTIITRHKADLRVSSRATAPGGTALPGGVTSALGGTGLPTGSSYDSASRATDPLGDQCDSASRRNAATVMSPAYQPREIEPQSSPSTEGAPLPSATSATSHPSTPRHLDTSTPSSLLLRALDLEARYRRKLPAPREPHSAKTILTRVGSSRSRDHPLIDDQPNTIRPHFRGT